MKLKWKVILIVLVTIIIAGVAIFLLYESKSDTDIPTDYIAVFHGGVGEQTHETYIYKIENGHDNYGFRYINVTSTTEYWGSTNWIQKITDKGTFDWTDGAFKVAKENGAYSYVTIPNSDKIYTIEEFQRMFLMD